MNSRVSGLELALRRELDRREGLKKKERKVTLQLWFYLFTILFVGGAHIYLLIVILSDRISLFDTTVIFGGLLLIFYWSGRAMHK